MRWLHANATIAYSIVMADRATDANADVHSLSTSSKSALSDSRCSERRDQKSTTADLCLANPVAVLERNESSRAGPGADRLSA